MTHEHSSNVKYLLRVVAFAFLIAFAVPSEGAERISRVGFLGVNDAAGTKDFIDAFRQGLRELGYIERENILIEYRWANGKPENLSKLATELVALDVDVIFAAAAPSVTAAKTATKQIPIVFEMLADPVSTGLVNSLPNPGANLTGIAGLAPELSGKRLELLKEIVPRLTTVALLGNPANPNFPSVLRESEIAAAGLKLQVQLVEVRERAELENAFERIANGRIQALSVIPDSMLFAQRKTIINSQSNTDCRPCSVCLAWPKSAGSCPILPTSAPCGIGQLFMSTRFSRARALVICRSSSQPNSSW